LFYGESINYFARYQSISQILKDLLATANTRADSAAVRHVQLFDSYMGKAAEEETRSMYLGDAVDRTASNLFLTPPFVGRARTHGKHGSAPEWKYCP
jgi:hypothetical protein